MYDTKEKEILTVESGILTDKGAYEPSALFNALSQLQENCVPVILVACSAKKKVH